jgi:hypothetical protein
MDNSPEAIYKRILENPAKHAPTILGRASSSRLNGLPPLTPQPIARAYVRSIDVSTPDKLNSKVDQLKGLNPQKVIDFIGKNPDLFKGVQRIAPKANNLA